MPIKLRRWSSRIVGVGTEKYAEKGDLVMTPVVDPPGWSTPAIIRLVAKNGALFLYESLIVFGTVVQILKRKKS